MYVCMYCTIQIPTKSLAQESSRPDIRTASFSTTDGLLHRNLWAFTTSSPTTYRRIRDHTGCARYYDGGTQKAIFLEKVMKIRI